MRMLLNKHHPLANYNFARVFGVCFEAESLSSQIEMIAEVCGMFSYARDLRYDDSISSHSQSVTSKRARLPPSDHASLPRQTFLPEDVVLLEEYSAEKLEYMSDLVNMSIPPAAQSHMKPITIDLSDSSSSGFLTASLTAMVEKLKMFPVVTLILNHNSIRSFPLLILDFSTLLQLDLSWNMLTSMPSGIDHLSQLQVLNLSHNQFAYFPSSILKLHSSLLELYMQDNKIEEIRNDFLKLNKLKVLDVSNNCLRNIPSRLNTHMKLKFFRFSGNPIFDVVATHQPKQTRGTSTQGILKFSSTSSSRTTKKRQRKSRNSKKNKR
mmetsp:Transcript_6134/g.10031  ORF Transcript_6134/g.10031 Transcript_6134/m.10031 type:complete len:323 (-) Transcript_6134:1464-2432(-)